jgi:hypothetical protein
MAQIKPFVYCLLGLAPKEKYAELLDKVFIPCISQDFGPTFEKQLEKNGTGFLVGDSLTWVDFYLACFSDYIVTFGKPEILDKFPRLGYHKNAVFSLPQVQEHVRNRPETLF